MRILIVEPERRPEIREIDDSLKAMQDIVGGLIQSIYLDDSVALVCNDEGKPLILRKPSVRKKLREAAEPSKASGPSKNREPER